MSSIPPSDCDILRALAARKAELSEHPNNATRRSAWLQHDAGPGGRPMVLAEIGGVLNEVLPLESCQCVDPWARSLEHWLRSELYQWDVLRDDHVLDPYINTNWKIAVSDYGAAPTMHLPETGGHLGARTWDAALQNLDDDLHRLHPRSFSVDRAATAAEVEKLEQVFQGICPVRLHGAFFWTVGMTWTAIEMIGLEGLMLSMYDNPAGVHRLMQFLHDDTKAFLLWLESEKLLSPNNENDYIGSGSMGYTCRLPGGESGTVRLRDTWGLLESQETVGVGPEQFEEFIFPYQNSLAGLFGMVYYGCCEPVHTRWEVLRNLQHLERVSVSPWADEKLMAAACGQRFVYSRKPNPAMISTEHCDEVVIRADLRQTLTTARQCRVELIMKDVHTVSGHPERLARWVELAREVVEEIWS